MSLFSFFPVIIINLAIIVCVIILINKWVNTSLSLKQEQNDLLREILRKMDTK